MGISKKEKQNYVGLTIDELKKEIARIELEFISMNLQKSIKMPDNPMKIRKVRKLIAFLKTILREKELGIRK